MKAPTLSLDLRWHALRQRFDALARRERALVIGAGAALTFMLADSLWLTRDFKAWGESRQRTQAIPELMVKTAAEAQRAAEVAALQALQLQAELKQLRSRLRDGEAAMREVQSALVGPDRMVALLDQVLAHQGQVRLREMAVLRRTDLAPEVAAAAGAAAASAAAATSTGRPSLYRHGIDITLEGSYADLVAYLDTLEAMPQHLLWGAMKLKVGQDPKALLTLRVYTLSLDSHWLEI